MKEAILHAILAAACVFLVLAIVNDTPSERHAPDFICPLAAACSNF